MDASKDGRNENKKLVSRESLITTTVVFVSQTDRPVDVIWLDFAGNSVKYTTLPGRGSKYGVSTFVTHPWIFRDSIRGDPLLANRNSVFWPQQNDEDDLTTVQIGIPLFSLRDRCLQEVDLIYDDAELLNLTIPVVLKGELKHRWRRHNTAMEEYVENSDN